jgi:hypothetical protein
VTLYIEQFLLRLIADVTSVTSLVWPILTNPRPYVWHHNLTRTVYNTVTNVKKSGPRSILTNRIKIWNSKETSHFKPHRTFHNSLQTHTHTHTHTWNINTFHNTQPAIRLYPKFSLKGAALKVFASTDKQTCYCCSHRVKTASSSLKFS